MKAIIYVEGPSDRAALGALLAPIVERKLEEGVSIRFVEAPAGDRKTSLLTRGPVRAADIIANDADAVVALLPDLYPRNKGFPHETPVEMAAGCMKLFQQALEVRGRGGDERLLQRLRPFCLKYDLEALLLAVPDGLQARLGGKALTRTWTVRVEDQDHDVPPKRIVEKLFENCGKRYRDTVDAPMILSGVSYRQLADLCPQCFAPFADFLENLPSLDV